MAINPWTGYPDFELSICGKLVISREEPYCSSCINLVCPHQMNTESCKSNRISCWLAHISNQHANPGIFRDLNTGEAGLLIGGSSVWCGRCLINLGPEFEQRPRWSILSQHATYGFRTCASSLFVTRPLRDCHVSTIFSKVFWLIIASAHSVVD